MFKLSVEIETHCPLSELSRYGSIVTAYDTRQQLLQIDLKHSIVARSRLEYPPLNVRCLYWQGKWEYFSVMLDRIKKGTSLVSESNEKAEFTGPIDCQDDALIFSKYHHNYKKHSLNHLQNGHKQILKLSDAAYQQLIFVPNAPKLVYLAREAVSMIDLNAPQNQTTLFRKASFLHDTHHIYSVTVNLQGRVREEYSCGIFDFRTGKHQESWVLKEPPIKIEAFGNTLITAQSQNIELYDLRKLYKPFQRENIKGVRDFVYEPNISRLLVGCESRLKVYKFNRE